MFRMESERVKDSNFSAVFRHKGLLLLHFAFLRFSSDFLTFFRAAGVRFSDHLSELVEAWAPARINV